MVRAYLVFKIINRCTKKTVRTFMFRSDAQAAFDKYRNGPYGYDFELIETMEAE